MRASGSSLASRSAACRAARAGAGARARRSSRRTASRTAAWLKRTQSSSAISTPRCSSSVSARNGDGTRSSSAIARQRSIGIGPPCTHSASASRLRVRAKPRDAQRRAPARGARAGRPRDSSCGSAQTPSWKRITSCSIRCCSRSRQACGLPEVSACSQLTSRSVFGISPNVAVTSARTSSSVRPRSGIGARQRAQARERVRRRGRLVGVAGEREQHAARVGALRERGEQLAEPSSARCRLCTASSSGVSCEAARSQREQRVLGAQARLARVGADAVDGCRRSAARGLAAAARSARALRRPAIAAPAFSGWAASSWWTSCSATP